MSLIPAMFIAMCRTEAGTEHCLHDYTGKTEAEVVERVLAQAKREDDYKGSGPERMAALGWWVEPIYRATPAAKWRKDGQPDPHHDLYDCERAHLCMGNYTDDELANAVYLHGDKKMTGEQIVAGEILPIAVLTAAKERIRWLSRALAKAQAEPRLEGTLELYEARVGTWMGKCFLPSLYSNMTERGDRLLEEVLELLQSNGYDPMRVPTLVEYVYGRPVGKPVQEVGGVMVTLAGYCYIAKVPMATAAWDELRRIEDPVVMDKIRAKQAAKNALHFDTPVPGNAGLQVVPLTPSDSQEIDPRTGPIPARRAGERRVGDPGYRVGIDPMPGSTRDMEEMRAEANSGDSSVTCDLPPEGWHCTRGGGHSGPCAAVPNPVDQSWRCECGQANTGWATECGRCQKPKGLQP